MYGQQCALSLHLSLNVENLVSHIPGSESTGIQNPVFSELDAATDCTGCLKKKWDLFYDQYLHQNKHKSAEYIYHFNAPLRVQLFLYDIREPK